MKKGDHRLPGRTQKRRLPLRAGEVQRLRSTLDRIDRKGYGAYKDLQGSYDLREFDLFVDRVQRDPFAPPSLIRVRTKENRFDPGLFEGPVRRVAFEDFLTRAVDTSSRGWRWGSRRAAGRWTPARPGRCCSRSCPRSCAAPSSRAGWTWISPDS